MLDMTLEEFDKLYSLNKSFFYNTNNWFYFANHKKPSPEIYLTAAQRVGIEPRHCLVVEDAINGVQAAKAAGMLCLALTTSFTAEQLKQADWICSDLSEALNLSLI